MLWSRSRTIEKVKEVINFSHRYQCLSVLIRISSVFGQILADTSSLTLNLRTRRKQAQCSPFARSIFLRSFTLLRRASTLSSSGPVTDFIWCAMAQLFKFYGNSTTQDTQDIKRQHKTSQDITRLQSANCSNDINLNLLQVIRMLSLLLMKLCSSQ